jgi:hypothetical protein
LPSGCRRAFNVVPARAAIGKGWPSIPASINLLYRRDRDRKGDPAPRRHGRASDGAGGKSPNVVFADAGSRGAAKGTINAIFYGKGEPRSAGSRLLVEESIHDALMEKVVERARKMAPGDRMNPKTRLSALVSVAARHGRGYVEAGKRRREASPAATARRSAAKGFRADGVRRGTPQMRTRQGGDFGPVRATLMFGRDRGGRRRQLDDLRPCRGGLTRDVKKAPERPER